LRPIAAHTFLVEYEDRIVSRQDRAAAIAEYRVDTLVGKYLTVGNPIKLSDSPADVRRSPLLGEHTVEILRNVLGLGDDEIEAARRQGAI
jgi:crotonobetainyl-CoA:carnitine CoA-transferase CaiB-like acyl-CoA transferase